MKRKKILMPAKTLALASLLLFAAHGAEAGDFTMPQIPPGQAANLLPDGAAQGNATNDDGEQGALREILDIGFDAYFGAAPETPGKLAQLYARFPLNGRVRHLAGRQMLREKNHAAAILMLTPAAEQDSQNRMLQSDTGKAFEMAQRWAEALRYYERAKDLSPYSAFRYNDCARVLESMGENDRALQYYRQSLKLFSRQPDIERKMRPS
jgi:tetratricopeptide (TPR) repeat protein